MKAIIKICTANKQFNQDQINIIKRVERVLTEHHLSVAIKIKIKKDVTINNYNLKAV